MEEKGYPQQFIGITLCGDITNSGTSCKAPAMSNGKCRWHGGRNRGAPRGNQNALKHGLYTAKAMQEQKELTTKLKRLKFLKRACGLI